MDKIPFWFSYFEYFYFILILYFQLNLKYFSYSRLIIFLSKLVKYNNNNNFDAGKNIIVDMFPKFMEESLKCIMFFLRKINNKLLVGTICKIR